MLLQDYAAYATEDHAVWSILYERQQRAIGQVAYSQFSTSLGQLGMSEHAIPEFLQLNTTGITYPLDGIFSAWADP